MRQPCLHEAASTSFATRRLHLGRLQVWVRPSAEMQFLYGNHVLKSGLGRITEGTPAYTGVVRHFLQFVQLHCV